MNSAFFLALRRLRAPLIVLIAIFSISVIGLVLIPGADADGKPWKMGFFHALYFVSYMATTIGFGEIPYAFTDAQRLWVTFCIFLTVIGWAYAIGKLLAVIQDRSFRQAVTTQRFERAVRQLEEPFYLICGFGETGALLCRSLDRLNLRCVVLDIRAARIEELELQDLRADVPGLAADARVPGNLLLAGLAHPYCRGVVALSSDDSVNLAVAIAARLLNPDLPALCRAATAEVAANMASFGTEHIIDPFDKFGEYLALAIRAPGAFRLLEWLTGVPGTELAAERVPPRGRWIVCGYGRFGQAVVRHCAKEGLDAAVIEVRPKPADVTLPWIVGEGTQAATLREAGVERAVGLVAGTDHDINNLSIAVTARELNPRLFEAMRQNRQANGELFRAFAGDFTVVPGEIIAHECLAIITSPLLARFLAIVKRKDDAWADGLIQRLSRALGREVPATWTITVDGNDAPALAAAVRRGPVRLDRLLRAPSDRSRPTNCVPLLAVRRSEEIELPEGDLSIEAGDRLLFAGLAQAREDQQVLLRNENVLDYVLFGRETGGGWLWRKLSGRAAER
jgi:Trk K+ transport system NAD-binding subunit